MKFERSTGNSNVRPEIRTFDRKFEVPQKFSEEGFFFTPDALVGSLGIDFSRRTFSIKWTESSGDAIRLSGLCGFCGMHQGTKAHLGSTKDCGGQVGPSWGQDGSKTDKKSIQKRNERSKSGKNVQIQKNRSSENFGGTSNFRSNVQNPEKRSNSEKRVIRKFRPHPQKSYKNNIKSYKII